MATILAISSQVASGHVGLSAMVPALQACGHNVIALPTVLLANHPGRQPTTGMRVDADVLETMLEMLGKNGRLDGVEAVLTGYLPSAFHVAFAVMAVNRCRAANSKLITLCDPVIGDDPKGVYIDATAAVAIRDNLLALADIITPNRFELGWLSGRPVSDILSAIEAARALGRPTTVATSIPVLGNRLATLAVTDRTAEQVVVARRAGTPNGTGDLLAALYLAATLDGRSSNGSALEFAVGGVDRVLAESVGGEELRLAKQLWYWIADRGIPK